MYAALQATALGVQDDLVLVQFGTTIDQARCPKALLSLTAVACCCRFILSHAAVVAYCFCCRLWAWGPKCWGDGVQPRM